MAFPRPVGRHTATTLRPLLGLPPALRQSIYQTQPLQRIGGVRHFNFQTIVHSSDTAGYVALLPASTMELIHSIGLPWYAVLPLSAVLIRSLLVYPYFQKPLRQTQAERAALQPLVDARMSLARRALGGRNVNRGSESSQKWRLRYQRWRFSRNLGIELFGHAVVPMKRGLSFFTLIAVSDAIRRLCGAREGLLKLLLGPFDWVASWMLPASLTADTVTNVASTTTPAVAETMVQDTGLTPVTDHPAEPSLPGTTTTISLDPALLQPQSEAVAATATTTSVDHLTSSPWFDPSLMTQGLPFCPDLTSADPTLILPFIFSTSFFLSIYLSPRLAGQPLQKPDTSTSTSPSPSTTATATPAKPAAAPKAAATAAPKATNMQRIAMTIAMLSIVPALHMPVALLLYFISNIWISAVQTRWLAYTVPIRSAPMACRRPVRTKSV